MDDLKLFTKTKVLDSLVQSVRIFSNDIMIGLGSKNVLQNVTKKACQDRRHRAAIWWNNEEQFNLNSVINT